MIPHLSFIGPKHRAPMSCLRFGKNWTPTRRSIATVRCTTSNTDPSKHHRNIRPHRRGQSMSAITTTYAHDGRDTMDVSRLELEKSPSGIEGLDEITGGGLPKGRPTLVCGGPGCGKTLLAIEFLVRGATEYGEPGVLVTFEETGPELARNVRSLGFDLEQLARENRLRVDYVQVEREQIEETGDYDLEGLFVRLGFA